VVAGDEREASEEADLTVPGEDEETQQYERAPEQSTLEEEAASWYDTTLTVFYPDWTAPSTGPVYFREARPGEILQASQPSEASQASQIEADPKPRTGT